MRRRKQKALPENIEAERSVLGAVLLNEDAYEATAPIAAHDPREVFAIESHALLYNAFRVIKSNGGSIDPVTVIGCLKELGDYESVTATQIAEIAGSVPTSANVGYYVQIVMDAYTRRKLIELARRIDALGMGAPDEKDKVFTTAELLRHAQWQIENLTQVSAAMIGGDVMTAAHLADVGLRDVERIAELNGKPSGCPTGLSVLDGYIHGWDKGDYITLGAKPGTGKSAFAINAMIAAAQNNVPVLMFSCEMTPERICSRCFGILTGMHAYSLQRGFNTHKEVSAAKLAAKEMRSFKAMHIDPVMRLTMPRIRQMSKQQVDKYGTSLIIVDYIGRIKLGRRTESRRHEMEAISGEFQGLAKELNTPVLVLSQINAEGEFKEAAAINEDSDIAIKFENLDDKQLTKAAADYQITNKWIVERLIGMRLSKNRNGPVGNKYIIFEKETQRFYPVTQEITQEQKIYPQESEQQQLSDYKEEEEEWPY